MLIPSGLMQVRVYTLSAVTFSGISVYLKDSSAGNTRDAVKAYIPVAKLALSYTISDCCSLRLCVADNPCSLCS
jgi:hypothetical protein